uniref:ATP synthase F0 subunit 8 n=1 Tax=Chalcorana labialis TaxID=391865 RepID=UPI00226CA9EB|nr:ATP synthase F0 subunit 8 [Chalcorana labialis]UZC57507.1 ATP synthase F0 subunit 8 [Chalcorana labialis]
MPQLNPDPWFLYFLLTWFIFIFILPQKVLSHFNLTKFNPKFMKTTYFSWTWPW